MSRGADNFKSPSPKTAAMTIPISSSAVIQYFFSAIHLTLAQGGDRSNVTMNQSQNQQSIIAGARLVISCRRTHVERTENRVVLAQSIIE